MARRTVVQLVDDLSGEELAPGTGETVRLALDGAVYELDLAAVNVAKLRDDLARYTDAGRRVGRASRQGRRPAMSAMPVDPRAVRAWAGSNGVSVSGRGRIPAAVVAQFRAAGN